MKKFALIPLIPLLIGTCSLAMAQSAGSPAGTGNSSGAGISPQTQSISSPNTSTPSSTTTPGTSTYGTPSNGTSSPYGTPNNSNMGTTTTDQTTSTTSTMTTPSSSTNGMQNEMIQGTGYSVLVAPDSQIHWVTGPAYFPRGGKAIVLTGDMTTTGPFSMRLKLPSNYKIGAYSSSVIEQIFVISGNIKVKFSDTDTRMLRAGNFIAIQPSVQHSISTDKGADILMMGCGPAEITYVTMTDDPRHQ